MTEHSIPVLHVHVARPEWGRARLVSELDGKRTFQFEDGASRSFPETYWEKVLPVNDLGEDEARAVDVKLRSLFDQTEAQKARTTKKQKAAAQAEPPATTFEAQLEQFESAFPGSFPSEKYTTQERGNPAQPRSREGAIALAQRELGREDLDALIAAGNPQGIFGKALEVAKGTRSLLHPTGELAPLMSLAPELHAEAGLALRELLYGEGAIETRFDRFVAALKTTKPGWPVATLFLALVWPKEHLFARSTLLKTEAAIVGIDLGYESVPSGAGYARMLSVANTVAQRLRERGHQPRDLMDVLAFMGKTLKGAGKGRTSQAPKADEDD